MNEWEISVPNDLSKYESSSIYLVLSSHYYSINLCERPLWMECQVHGARHGHNYNNLVIVSQCNYANLLLVHQWIGADRKCSNSVKYSNNKLFCWNKTPKERMKQSNYVKYSWVIIIYNPVHTVQIWTNFRIEYIRLLKSYSDTQRMKFS